MADRDRSLVRGVTRDLLLPVVVLLFQWLLIWLLLLLLSYCTVEYKTNSKRDAGGGLLVVGSRCVQRVLVLVLFWSASTVLEKLGDCVVFRSSRGYSTVGKIFLRVNLVIGSRMTCSLAAVYGTGTLLRQRRVSDQYRSDVCVFLTRPFGNKKMILSFDNIGKSRHKIFT